MPRPNQHLIRDPTTEPLTDCRARGGEAVAGTRCVEWRRRRSAAGGDLHGWNPSKRGVCVWVGGEGGGGDRALRW
jgi:hypothetical protein